MLRLRDLPVVQRMFARPRSSPRTGEISRIGGVSGGTVGQFFLNIGKEKRPTGISFTDMEDMSADPQIAASLALVKMPIASVRYRISCEDKGNKEIPEHCEKALRKIWLPLVRYTLTALDYGFSAQEKRWVREKGYWWWKTFLPVSARQVTILRDGNDFNGFVQLATAYNAQMASAAGVDPVPPDKSFLYTHDPPFGNLYGRPRTWAAYKSWWIKKHIIRFASVYYEKSAQPLREGRAPVNVEKIAEDGSATRIDAQDWMHTEILKKIQAGATDYVLPSDRDEYGQFIWDVVQKELSKRGVDYIDYMRYLDVMESRGIFIPDLTVFQNLTTGSRAMSESHGDVFWRMELGQLADIKSYIDLYLLPQMVAYNFGVDAPACYWEFEPLTPDQVEWLRRLVDRMVQADTVRPDLEEVQDRLGMKLSEVEPPKPQQTLPGEEEGDEDEDDSEEDEGDGEEDDGGSEEDGKKKLSRDDEDEDDPDEEHEEARRRMEAYLGSSHLW